MQSSYENRETFVNKTQYTDTNRSVHNPRYQITASTSPAPDKFPTDPSSPITEMAAQCASAAAITGLLTALVFF